jgi:transposase
VFLKKPERIAALMMIMTLCLMVYAFAQHHMRQKLEESKETLPNQLKKQTSRPTLAWVFRLMHGIQLIKICAGDIAQELVININETRKKIIRLFGRRAMEIYGIT